MDKKEIQEERMRGYFIQSTKEILKGEGLKSLSVRNIADRAGYSYATLYNYFKDIKDLIFECVLDFQKECETEIQDATSGIEPGIERIKKASLAYINYFVQYPGVFELFFLEKVRDIASKKTVTESIYTFTDRLTETDWEYCISKSIFNRDEALQKKENLKLAITGLLLYYLNRQQPESYMDFRTAAGEQIGFILQSKA